MKVSEVEFDQGALVQVCVPGAARSASSRRLWAMGSLHNLFLDINMLVLVMRKTISMINQI